MHRIKYILIIIFLFIVLFAVDLLYSSISLNRTIEERKNIEEQSMNDRTQLIENTSINSPTPQTEIFSDSVESPKAECLGSYTSPIHHLLFTYDHCFFGKAQTTIEKDKGCGSVNKPAEKITFSSNPFIIYINQTCGIFYESSLPILKQYQIKTKSGQVFHVDTRAYKNTYGIEAYFRGKNTVEIVSKTDTARYTDPQLLQNKLNTIIQTMDTDL